MRASRTHTAAALVAAEPSAIHPGPRTDLHHLSQSRADLGLPLRCSTMRRCLRCHAGDDPGRCTGDGGAEGGAEDCGDDDGAGAGAGSGAVFEAGSGGDREGLSSRATSVDSLLVEQRINGSGEPPCPTRTLRVQRHPRSSNSLRREHACDHFWSIAYQTSFSRTTVPMSLVDDFRLNPPIGPAAPTRLYCVEQSPGSLRTAWARPLEQLVRGPR